MSATEEAQKAMEDYFAAFNALDEELSANIGPVRLKLDFKG